MKRTLLLNIHYTTRVKLRNILSKEARVLHFVRFNIYEVLGREIKAIVTKMKIVISSGSLGALGKGGGKGETGWKGKQENILGWWDSLYFLYSIGTINVPILEMRELVVVGCMGIYICQLSSNCTLKILLHVNLSQF